MDDVGEGAKQVVFWGRLPEEGSPKSKDSKAELGSAQDSGPGFHAWWGLEVNRPVCGYEGEKGSQELVEQVCMGSWCLI